MADAYVKPILDRYLTELDGNLRRLGFEGRFYVMLSAGASGSLETALRYPIRLTESGPAAGAVAAGHYARQLGAEAVVSFDMGGTTAKAAMVEHGRPEVGKSIEVDRV